MTSSISKWFFLFFAMAGVNIAYGQYGGGAGNGESSLQINNATLAGDVLQMLYGGGIGQGSTVAYSFASTIDGIVLSAIYVGNAGKGDTQASLFAQLLSGDNVNVLFIGGSGRGDRVGTKSSFALGGDAADIIYYGGAGRGDTAIALLNNALFDCTVQNMWTGKVSTAWEEVANWSCNELPGINSNVLIPSSVPRYPAVNASTEIKRLQIDPGASVTIKVGFQLKLNGL